MVCLVVDVVVVVEVVVAVAAVVVMAAVVVVVVGVWGAAFGSGGRDVTCRIGRRGVRERWT
ncbi:hypothetical protein ACO0M4_20850 [Streptomyces sp. RGM 3693]|uniref:hypothetical protein n=1 Tax=Streptomyces sp. RGM 3693 TaxID=3413284 RepID=UPI003D2A4AF6